MKKIKNYIFYFTHTFLGMRPSSQLLSRLFNIVPCNFVESKKSKKGLFRRFYNAQTAIHSFKSPGISYGIAYSFRVSDRLSQYEAVNVPIYCFEYIFGYFLSGLADKGHVWLIGAVLQLYSTAIHNFINLYYQIS